MKAMLAETDRQIAEATQRANAQVCLIPRLPPGSRERDAAVTLLADLNRSLEAWERNRNELIRCLDPRGAAANEPSAKAAARQRRLVDARRWRLKAEELRTAAANMKKAEAATVLLRLANDYDVLAERAEAREAPAQSVEVGSGHL